MKTKIYALSFLLLVFLFSPAIVCAQVVIDLDVSVTCTSTPATVQVGDTVTIGLQFINEDPINQVTLNKSAISALFPDGNIFGPFTIPINLTLNPNETASIPNYITYTMPATGLSSVTVVGHLILVCRNNFDDCETASCGVEVIP